MQRRKRGVRLEKNLTLKTYVHEKLLAGWSPWQIEGRLKKENEGRCIISHETIYRYIYSDYGIRNQFLKKLRRKHFVRVKRGARKPRVPKDMLIHTHPAFINDRAEFGHWECDYKRMKSSSYYCKNIACG